MDALNNRFRESQGGFSLMETLLALAIMSVASLALFQSTATLLRLSERTTDAALRSQDKAILQHSFAGLINGLVPAWPNDQKNIFTGTSSAFSGLTRKPFQTLEIGLIPFSLSLESNGRESLLVYRSGETEWVLQKFPGVDAQFLYLGADNLWRKSWPPEATPEAGKFGDAKYFDPPAFPLAIQLLAANAKTVWIANINSDGKLPDLKEY